MTFRKLVTSLFMPKPSVLGRWNLNKTEQQKHASFIFANTDHCGDQICGHPSKTKTFLENTQRNYYKKQ